MRLKRQNRSLLSLRGKRPTTPKKYAGRPEAALTEYQIWPSDVWNFDEMGFRIGIGGSEWIVTTDPKPRVWTLCDTNRKHVTIVETISAKGRYIDPMIILPGKKIYERWFENDRGHQSVLGVSDTGYMNDQLALRYIQHFNEAATPRNPGKWRLLLCDNLGSHVFREFLQYAADHRIVVFGLPPHTSHFLQPLDAGLFQPYKHYRRAILDATRIGCTHFGITTFLGVIQEIRMKTFTEHNIRKAFRKSGIWPVDPDLIMRFLRLEYGLYDGVTVTT